MDRFGNADADGEFQRTCLSFNTNCGDTGVDPFGKRQRFLRTALGQ
jgi:hypothetical protein